MNYEQTLSTLIAEAIDEFDVKRLVKMAKAVDWTWQDGKITEQSALHMLRHVGKRVHEAGMKHKGKGKHWALASGYTAGFSYAIEGGKENGERWLRVKILWGLDSFGDDGTAYSKD